MSDFWDQFTSDASESGIPDDDSERDVYWDMGADMDITDDAFAMDTLWTGWFDEDAGADERLQAREDFFDYMDMDPADFDWDDWRDWYEG